MAKVLCVLYDDPVTGYPSGYARDAIPRIDHYPGGQTAPTPKAIDFTPGALLGSVSGELGLRKYLESNGHQFVVTADKDGPNSLFERELVDADVVISQPFWPAYLTAERIAKAPKLKLAITAGIGSDHVDLQAAIDRRHHRRRGDVFQFDQRLRACGDDDPRARTQLHSLLRVGCARRLAHRRLRGTFLRYRGHARGDCGSRPDRPRDPAPAETLRRAPALFRIATVCRMRPRRSWASPGTGASSIWSRFATW